LLFRPVEAEMPAAGATGSRRVVRFRNVQI
jgi:hypothetical protein